MTSLTLPRALLLKATANPLAVVVAVAAAFRLLLLGAACLWYDETGAVWMASLPFGRMLAATGGDTHPPGYLALLWVWVRLFGVSEIAVRLPSVLFSLAAIVLTWRVGERLGFERRALTIAAGLMAVNPAQIYFAQEARMYALLECEFLVGLIAVLDRRWGWFGASLAAMYWTHNYGLVFTLPLNVVAVVMIVRRWRESVGWLWANAIAFGSWLPWLAVLAGQMREVQAGYWIPPLQAGSALDTLQKIWWGLIINDELQGHAAIVLGGALTYALLRAVLQRSRPALVAANLAIAPLAIVVAASAAWRPILLFRGFIPIVPLLCLVFGWAFADLSFRGRLVALLLVAPVMAGVVTLYYARVAIQKGDPRVWLNEMDWREGDVIYHSNEGSYMALHFYTPPEWPQYMLPRGEWRNLGALSDGTKGAMGFHVAPLDGIEWRRAWLLAVSGPTTSAGEDAAIADLLARYPNRLIRMETYPVNTFALYLIYNPAYAK